MKFAIWALKDRNIGNLDRVQIVKGWFEPPTELAEKLDFYPGLQPFLP